MAISALYVFSLICSLVGTAVSLGMMALVLWQAPNQTINRLLALYMGSIAGWALTTFLFRVTGSVDIIKVSAVCFSLMPFLLLAAASYYTQYWRYRLVRALLVLGAVFFFVVVPIVTANTTIFVDANPHEFAGRIFHLNPVGYGIGTILLVLSLLSSVLLWRSRKQKESGLLLPALLTPISVISLGLPLSFPIPMMIAAASSVLLSRAILRQNMFNPLLEVTKVLTASEAHYRAIAEELTRKEALYRTLARNLPNTTVGLFDHDMRCLIFEGQPLTIRGIRIDHTVEGQLLSQALPAEIQQGMTDLYQAAFAGQEVQLQRVFDGRDFHVHAMPVGDERGKLFAGMIVLQDITDIKEAERQTMQLSLENERNLILRRFIADATHDLMTPISGMRLSVDILQRELKDQPSAKRLDSLSSYTQRLTVLLQDMLEATSLDESDSLDLRMQDVNGLVGNAVMRLTDMLTSHHHHIALHCDELPLLMVDGLKLTRVFANLIQNAIAYTPEGGTITVTTTCTATDIVVTVMDTGIGIRSDETEKIFERFYRVDKARNMEEGGAGLGLSIARRIIDLHHGRIEVSSEVGKGSSFTVTLPLPVPVSEPELEPESELETSA